MRHVEPGASAPFKSAPMWPAGYLAVLRVVGAQEKTLPSCLGWVRCFFATFPGRRRRDLGRSEVESFLPEIAQCPEVSNWQIAQARQALELYYEQFRSIALAQRPDTTAGRAPATRTPEASASRP